VSVLYQLSIKVPKAIAVGYRRKRRAVNRVENNSLLSWSFIKNLHQRDANIGLVEIPPTKKKLK